MNDPYKLNRKKVLKLASELYKTGNDKGKVVAFLKKYYPTYEACKIFTLVSRVLSQPLTWGRAQSIAWKMAKHEVRTFKAFVEAIQTDVEFSQRPKFYTVLTEELTFQGQRVKKEVIYTSTYGELDLTYRLKIALFPA